MKNLKPLPKFPFVVEYELNYVHRVVVGIMAADGSSAVEAAQAAFDAGTIWDNSDDIPLLYDDFEEEDGNKLEFTARRVDRFPTPDSSLKEVQRREIAFSVCRFLVAALNGRQIDEELLPVLRLAKEAVGEYANEFIYTPAMGELENHAADEEEAEFIAEPELFPTYSEARWDVTHIQQKIHARNARPAAAQCPSRKCASSASTKRSNLKH
jgi:hypothetical protein